LTNLEVLERIFELIQVGQWPIANGEPYQSFGLGQQSLSIIGGENLLECNQLVNFLHSKDREIYRSYSRKVFLEKLMAFIRPIKLKDVVPTQEQVREFFSSLRAEELKKFRVLREIFGIALKSPGSPCLIGNFKIYHFPTLRNSFEQTIGPTLQLMTVPKEPNYLIEYEVESREQNRAIEIADDYFKMFVLFLRHTIGTSDERFEVGILDYSAWKGRSAHVICGEQYFSNAERYGSYEPIPIDDPYFTNSESGYDKLWENIDKVNLSKLGKRICTAIEWIGRSLIEKTVQTAFIEASVALESIFTFSEKTIVTPSILSQISESVALLLGNTTEHRIAIEKQIKQLYSIRSGIVHAGDKEVAASDYNLFIQYIRLVIAKLLTEEAFIKCNTIEDVYSVLKHMKYS